VASMAIAPEEFRRTIGLFATGVTVVTTVDDGTLHGMTANAFASVSLDPLLVLVCVDRAAGLHERLPRSEQFAVTVLSAGQERESVWFADPGRPTGSAMFAEVAWRPAPVSGSPVLDAGLAYVDCRVTAIHEGGDHSIFVGEVVDLGRLRGEQPLIWYAGRYRGLG
jgi:flavin reductase